MYNFFIFSFLLPFCFTPILFWKTEVTFHFFSFILSVHVGSVRQTASIISMSQDTLRTGDKALVRFRFIKNPEYLRTDMRMVFREGRTKAVGNVTRLFPQTSGSGHYSRHQRAGKKSQQQQQHPPQQQQQENHSSSGGGGGHAGRSHNEPQKQSKKNRRPRNQKPYYNQNVIADSTSQASSSSSILATSSTSLSSTSGGIGLTTTTTTASMEVSPANQLTSSSSHT